LRLLIIEDEIRLADTLADLLICESYDVDISYDGESGLDNALTGIYDAVILDVMLPKLNGFEVLKRMRNSRISTPVMMLTARDDIESRVYGLDIGADYYLVKPYVNAELLACLRAILRRPQEIIDDALSFGDLQQAFLYCELRCGDRSVKLSQKELEIMRLLMLSGEKNVSKETLIVKIWGYNSNAIDNNVEAYISMLRKKLTQLKSTVSLLVVRRIGYHLKDSKNVKAHQS
jgi:DNA-binding response OmpR family regulator